MRRLLATIVVIVFFAGFALLTISAVSQQGFGVGAVLSVLVLLLLAVGIVGTLRNPPS